mgnify:CR=1 FL=1
MCPPAHAPRRPAPAPCAPSLYKPSQPPLPACLPRLAAIRYCMQHMPHFGGTSAVLAVTLLRQLLLEQPALLLQAQQAAGTACAAQRAAQAGVPAPRQAATEAAGAAQQAAEPPAPDLRLVGTLAHEVMMVTGQGGEAGRSFRCWLGETGGCLPAVARPRCLAHTSGWSPPLLRVPQTSSWAALTTWTPPPGRSPPEAGAAAAPEAAACVAGAAAAAAAVPQPRPTARTRVAGPPAEAPPRSAPWWPTCCCWRRGAGCTVPRRSATPSVGGWVELEPESRAAGGASGEALAGCISPLALYPPPTPRRDMRLCERCAGSGAACRVSAGRAGGLPRWVAGCMGWCDG